MSHFARCSAIEPFSEETYQTCEVRFDLAEMGLGTNSEFGFDIHFNVDNDGGVRDRHYSWCSGQTLEAWRDVSKIECSRVLTD